MAVNIVLIDANDPMSDGPQTINDNFTTVKSHVEELESLLNTSTNTLSLTNLTTLPANSIESAAIVLTKQTGNAIVIAPNGDIPVYTVDANGVTTGFKFVAIGDGDSNKSILQDVEIVGKATLDSDVLIKGILNLNQTDTQIVSKYRTIAIVDANCGSAATQKIDISKDQKLLLDYNNGGSALSGNADVNFDLTSVLDGQIFEIHLLRKNSSGNMKLYNGTSGTEIFAYIDANSGGFTIISSTSKPAFVPNASPDNQSYLKVQYINIGSGIKKLVVIESKNVSGVS